MTRENFCGLCTVIPLALAGAGAATLSTKEEYKTRKKLMLFIGLIVLFISLFLVWYWKDCEKCKK